MVRDGTSLSLDASSSEDEDGTIASYDWYVETADDDEVLTGKKVTATLPENEPASMTLVVTDNRGLTDFHTVNTPGIKWTSAPTAAPSDPVTIALLSSPDLDTRTLSELRWGGEQRRVNASNVTVQDANGDGRDDLVLRAQSRSWGWRSAGRSCAPPVCCPMAIRSSAARLSLSPPRQNPRRPADDGARPDRRTLGLGRPTDRRPSARADTSNSRGSLAGNGGQSALVLMAGALITAIAVSVLAAARRPGARS